MTDHTKLDSQAKYLLQSHEEASSADRVATTGIMIRGREPFTPDQLTALERMGIIVRTVSGDVLSADAPVSSIAAITDLNYVVSVQVSQPQWYEGPDQQAGFYSDVE